MVKPAVAVAKQLHLDVARAQDHLFQIALAIAEGRFGLAPALADLLDQFVGTGDGAHPAPAAAPAGLEHQGIADFRRLGLDGVEIVAQHLGRRDYRHACLDRHPPGAGLVAKCPHRVRAWPDKGDPGGLAGIHEFGVFRQQPIARMDRIRARFLCHTDDLGYRQISRDRPQPLADPIRLVRLETVKAQLVFLGIDRDRPLAQLIRSTQDANRYLTTIRDQNL